MKEFGIPTSSLAEMIGISRKTLTDIIAKKRRVTPRSKELISAFYDSWHFDKEHQCFVQGYINDINNYIISSEGYAYPKKQKKNHTIQKKANKAKDHLVSVTYKIKKSQLDAMKFHGEEPRFPHYDMWLLCTKCNFRILGSVRRRMKYECACGGQLRPCLNCVHYSSCDQTECNYRKRTTGMKCRNCGMFVSDRSNELMECGCGYINTYKDAESVSKVNLQEGFYD